MQRFFYNSLLASLLIAGSSYAQIGDAVQPIHQYDGTSIGMQLGKSVASAGDVDGDGVADILVGGPFAVPGGASEVGFVFVYSGATGDELYRLNNGEDAAHFGRSVCGIGDLNGDGIDDFAAGAPESNLGGNESGAVYLYSGASGSLIRQVPGFAGLDHFGYALAATGDLNGDGYPDYLVSANEAAPNGLTRAGSVFLLSGFDDAVLFQVDGTEAYGFVGDSVANAGDIDGDGTTDLLIGSRYTASNGQAWVYSGATGVLLHQVDGFNDGVIGLSVAGAGDVNQDGYADFLVGSPGAFVAGFGTDGNAVLYSGLDGSIIYTFDARSYGGGMGRSVAGVGDVDGDGIPDIVVGAHKANHSGASEAGAIYLYSGATGLKLHRIDSKSGEQLLGSAVAAIDDLDGDGVGDVLVGAPGASPLGIHSAGAAYVFSLRPYLILSQTIVSASTGALLDLTLNFPTDAAGFEYRVLVSLSGDGPFHFGVDIPLTFDNMLMRTYFGDYPFVSYSYLQGMLDSHGNATGHIGVPPGLYSHLVGNTVRIAAIANPVGQLPEYSSLGMPVVLVP